MRSLLTLLAFALFSTPIFAASRPSCSEALAKAMDLHEAMLTAVFEKARHEDLYHNPIDRHIIHEDPLACRYCVGASKLLLAELQREFPQDHWRMVRTSPKGAPYLGGYVHNFLYSDRLTKIIDPTYRQFAVHLPPEEFAKLPRIFIGPPHSFQKLMLGIIPTEGVRDYLRAVGHELYYESSYPITF